MDVVVYDRYWSTAGGGEAYAGGAAEALSRHHDVTLLAHEPLDLGWLGERLALDLRRCRVEVVAETTPLEVATAGHDLFVNASYRSHGRNGARHGLYVVHFPDRPGGDVSPWQRLLARWGRLLPGQALAIEPVAGVHEPDVIRWQQVRWTDGEGRVRVAVPPGAQRLTVHLGRFVPGGATRHVTVAVVGGGQATADLAPPRSRVEVLEPLGVDVDLPAGLDQVELVVTSEATRPADVVGGGDRRLLGVPIVAVTAGRSPSAALRRRASLLDAGPPDLSWLDSYDRVVANSAFTRRWVRTWWGVESAVLEPPVALRQPGEKAPIVLSVGRFFAAGRGHSKKQLEMVRAFRRLPADLAAGWELHLVGGCHPDDAAYLDEVRRAAEGAAVHLHVDASGAELADLYARASVYWHAAGLDEDLAADPVRAEHFGITTVEAMSAGAVPVVVAAGGQPEIVRDGIDGVLVHDLDGMVAATRALLADPARRDRMAASARQRAERYGRARFAERLDRLVAEVVSPAGRR